MSSKAIFFSSSTLTPLLARGAVGLDPEIWPVYVNDAGLPRNATSSCSSSCPTDPAKWLASVLLSFQPFAVHISDSVTAVVCGLIGRGTCIVTHQRANVSKRTSRLFPGVRLFEIVRLHVSLRFYSE